jgi:hypothetical protein
MLKINTWKIIHNELGSTQNAWEKKLSVMGPLHSGPI